MTDEATLRPYTMDSQPLSDGRTFLANAFAFFCVLEWGFSADEVERALLGDPAGCRVDAEQVAGGAQLFGRAFMEGRVETYARLFGGGSPVLVPRSAWELDDFRARFASSAINTARPFDRVAAPTHWLFVNTNEFNALLGLLDGSVVPAMVTAATDVAHTQDVVDAGVPPMRTNAVSHSDRFIKKKAVLDLVPFSRSTLDDRVKKGLFPKSHDLGGGIVVWRQSEVVAWMEGHSRRGD